MTTTTITLLTIDMMNNHGGARLIIGGKKCSFNSVRSYTLYNNAVYGENEDPAEAEAREMSKPGGQLYWINSHCSVISGDAGFYERETALWSEAPMVNVGDVVEFDGKKFKIMPTFNHNFYPELI